MYCDSPFLFFRSFLRSCAGIYTEWVLKRPGKEGAAVNFFAQQLQFGFFGIIFNVVVLIARRGGDIIAAKGNIFHNFTPLVCLVVLIITVNGLCTATIFKYLDNILNIFTQAGSMLITSVVSAFFFNFQPTVAFVAGFGVVLFAMFLYNATPAQVLTCFLCCYIPYYD